MNGGESMQLLLPGVGERLRGHGLTLPAAPPGSPGLDQRKILQRTSSLFPGQAEEARKQLGGHQRVSGRTMTRGIVEPKEPAETVQPAGAHASDQSPGQPNGTKPSPVQCQIPGAPQLGAQKVPVE